MAVGIDRGLSLVAKRTIYRRYDASARHARSIQLSGADVDAAYPSVLRQLRGSAGPAIFSV